MRFWQPFRQHCLLILPNHLLTIQKGFNLVPLAFPELNIGTLRYTFLTTWIDREYFDLLQLSSQYSIKFMICPGQIVQHLTEDRWSAHQVKIIQNFSGEILFWNCDDT